MPFLPISSRRSCRPVLVLRLGSQDRPYPLYHDPATAERVVESMQYSQQYHHLIADRRRKTQPTVTRLSGLLCRNLQVWLSATFTPLPSSRYSSSRFSSPQNQSQCLRFFLSMFVLWREYFQIEPIFTLIRHFYKLRNNPDHVGFCCFCHLLGSCLLFVGNPSNQRPYKESWFIVSGNQRPHLRQKQLVLWSLGALWIKIETKLTFCCFPILRVFVSCGVFEFSNSLKTPFAVDWSEQVSLFEEEELQLVVITSLPSKEISTAAILTDSHLGVVSLLRG